MCPGWLHHIRLQTMLIVLNLLYGPLLLYPSSYRPHPQSFLTVRSEKTVGILVSRISKSSRVCESSVAMRRHYHLAYAVSQSVSQTPISNMLPPFNQGPASRIIMSTLDPPAPANRKGICASPSTTCFARRTVPHFAFEYMHAHVPDAACTSAIWRPVESSHVGCPMVEFMSCETSMSPGQATAPSSLPPASAGASKLLPPRRRVYSVASTSTSA